MSTAFGTAVLALDDYRARVEGDYIANMAFLTWAENQDWSRSLVKVAAKPGVDYNDGWLFMWDESETGIEKGYARADFDPCNWIPIGVDMPGGSRNRPVSPGAKLTVAARPMTASAGTAILSR